MKKDSIFIIIPIILIIATAFAYSNSFKNDFVWDDRSFIIESPYIHNLTHWKELFIRNVGYSKGARNNFYRPLYTLSNAINYKMGNGTPFIFHVTNTLLHGMCAALVFILISLISNKKEVAFSTAILFALHPIQTQAVTYIAGRADPMYLVFALTSMILLIRHLNKKSNVSYIFSVLLFIPALLSKESAMIMPLLMLLYFYTIPQYTPEEKKKKIILLIPYFAILGLYILLRTTVLDFSKAAYATLALKDEVIGIRFLTSCKAIFMYLRFLFLPAGFHMETHLPYARSFDNPSTFLAFLGTIGLILFTLTMKKRNRSVFFGLSWFLLSLLPVLNVIYPVNATIAVHWLYLPSIGILFALITLLYDRLKENRALFISIILIIAFIFGVLTYNRNKNWKDEETLYNSILPYSQTPRVYVNLGNIYARKNEFGKAAFYYKKALDIAPGQTEIYVNLGYIYNTLKEYDKAEKFLKIALRLTPRHANAYYNLGVTYYNMRRYKEAHNVLYKAIELNPSHTFALNALADTYFNLGDPKKAVETLERSLKITPAQPDIADKLERIKKILELDKEG